MTPAPIRIRAAEASDAAAIRRVHVSAFGGDDEATLVERLRAGGDLVASLVAERAQAIVAHVLFSHAAIDTPLERIPAVSLAPMAVIPDLQRQGIGSVLLRAGLEECRRQGERIVLVVGHPGYYPRFGFSHALATRLENPFSSAPAFMALELEAGALADVTGRVRYPAAFDAFL